eukprot:gene18355-24821_t
MMRRATASASGFASTFLRRSRNTPMGLDVTARATGSLAGCVGGRVMEDVDTPSLLVDLEAFDRNCNRLKQVMAQWPAVSVRPHVKAHKCAELALRQMRILGIQGVCAQKQWGGGQAQVRQTGWLRCISNELVARHFLLSNEVAVRRKFDRPVGFAASGAKISVCVDGEVGLRELAAAAAKQGTSVGVVIEVNVGHDRCGVDTPAEAAKLAAAIASFPSLEFLGIQAYHGAQQHVRDPVDRHQRVVKSCSRASAAIQAIKDKAGLDCRVVTGVKQGDSESGRGECEGVKGRRGKKDGGRERKEGRLARITVWPSPSMLFRGEDRGEGKFGRQGRGGKRSKPGILWAEG